MIMHAIKLVMGVTPTDIRNIIGLRLLAQNRKLVLTVVKLAVQPLATIMLLLPVLGLKNAKNVVELMVFL